MKNLLLKLSLIGLMAAAFCGCEDTVDPVPGVGPFSLEMKKAGADYAEFYVTAPSELQLAYKVATEPQKILSEAILFVNAEEARKVITVSPGETFRISREIQENNHYYIYAVAKLDSKKYSKIYEFDFEAESYGYTDLITIIDTYGDGYKAHINFPESTIAKGNAIRYSGTSKAWYNVILNNYGGDVDYVDMLSITANGDPYAQNGKVLFEDTTLVMDDYNILAYDENGEVIRDDLTSEEITVHDPIAPGEPYILLAGECSKGDAELYNDYLGMMLTYEGEQYMIPCYDTTARKWIGAFQKKEFITKVPTECKAGVKVTIESVDVTDAVIRFEKDAEIYRYFYLILDDASYNMILSQYLNGDPAGFQWYATSYLAFSELGSSAKFESMTVNAGAEFFDGLVGGKDYHIICTAMADERGLQQSYSYQKFTAKPKTKLAPEFKVTEVPTNDPYWVAFNVKCPTKDIIKAYYACNYAREFELELNSGATYESLCGSNIQLSEDDIDQINTADGLTMWFPTLDGEKMRFAIYGCNDEYTYNAIKRNNKGAGWADSEAIMAPFDKKILSPLYQSLAGNWTMTADIKYNQDMGNDNIQVQTRPWSSNITIANEITGIPDQLESHVYDLYAGKNKTEVDGMFSELKKLVDKFAEYRLDGQNRLLCTGFIDFDYYTTKRMSYKSPYDLFKDEEYSSYDVPQLMYDFGPKWFLEVAKDTLNKGTADEKIVDKLFVPFSASTLPPLTGWPGYEFYLGGVGTVSFYDPLPGIPGFPVEIVDDNTLIIKPIEVKEDIADSSIKKGLYYMNALGIANMGSTSLELISTICSDIVLTRGWNNEENTAPQNRNARRQVQAVNPDGTPVTELPKRRIYKSLTPLKVSAPEIAVDENPNFVTVDMVERLTEKICRDFENRIKMNR